MKSKYTLLLLPFILLACDKQDDTVQVTYMVSNAVSSVNLMYLDEREEKVSLTIDFQSVEDIWTASFSRKRGDLAYLSAIYSDSASSVSLNLLMDGKTFKRTASNNEPDKYVIVSGVVPY